MVPDMATITVGARHEAGTAAEALARTSESVRDAISLLEAAGVAANDMQTSGLSVSPRWTRHNGDTAAAPRIIGYVASNSLFVRIREIDAPWWCFGRRCREWG